MPFGILPACLTRNKLRKLENFRDRFYSKLAFSAVATDGFLRSYKNLLSTGDITGLYVLHNRTKDVCCVGVTRMSMRTSSMVTISAFGSYRSRGVGIPI